VLLCACEDRCFYNCGSALRAAWDAASAGREGAAGTNLGLWVSACGTKCLVVVSTCSFADGFGQRRVTYQEALLCLRCGFMVFCLVLVSSWSSYKCCTKVLQKHTKDLFDLCMAHCAWCCQLWFMVLMPKARFLKDEARSGENGRHCHLPSILVCFYLHSRLCHLFSLS
jgi:hypothetical protein